MAEEDVPGGMAAENDAGDSASADDDSGGGSEAEWVAPDEAVALPPLMRASDLLPPEVEESEDDIPPTPEEADLQSLPLAQREALRLQRMSPEQRARYDAAQAEIMANPSVARFSQEEDRIRAAKDATAEAFLAAYRKKQKEKKA